AGQVPVEASCRFALLSDPGRHATAHLVNVVALLLPLSLKTKAPAKRQISGLNHAAFPLPVYPPAVVPASQLTTQDSVSDAV
ncbi:MAG: hypothetical protein ACQERO_13350, partial [Bacteroidota bacterium]